MTPRLLLEPEAEEEFLPDVLSVIAVIHGRRDPRRWQQRR